MSTDIRAALTRLLAVCDTDESGLLGIDPDQLLCAITDARDALAAVPAGEGPSLTEVDELCERFGFHPAVLAARPATSPLLPANYRACNAVLAARPAAPAVVPGTPAEDLAARPLLEQVARLGGCIGANTVGQITAISDRAAAWLRDNPPGQPVRIEPRGCPLFESCSCVEPAPSAPRPEVDWFAVQMVARDMQISALDMQIGALAMQAAGDELLKLANSNRSQPVHPAAPAAPDTTQPTQEDSNV